MFEALFQTFEDPEGGVALSARLAALREELAAPAAHRVRRPPRGQPAERICSAQSEERLAWLTGFTGSAGLAAVAQRPRSAVCGRPLYAASGQQVDTAAWTIASLIEPPPEILADCAFVSRRPPRIRSLAAHFGGSRAPRKSLRKGRSRTGRRWTAIRSTRSGQDRPAAPLGPVKIHDLPNSPANPRATSSRASALKSSN
jgi:Xaa-Pro aminopeptidase